MALLTFLAVRIYDTQRGLPLEPWHIYVPHELHAKKLDAANWTQYLAAEATIFEDVQREVSRNLEGGDRVPANRYFDGSPVYPAHFAQDFNRSFVLEPEGKPVGAVVLLHGLTDSPTVSVISRVSIVITGLWRSCRGCRRTAPFLPR